MDGEYNWTSFTSIGSIRQKNAFFAPIGFPAWKRQCIPTIEYNEAFTSCRITSAVLSGDLAI